MENQLGILWNILGYGFIFVVLFVTIAIFVKILASGVKSITDNDD